MGRKLFEHICYGFAMTVAIVIVVQLAIAGAGQGLVTPEFAARFASREAAALAQLGLVGLIGAAFAGAALVFEIEHWSYLAQGAAHFLITAAVWVPVALLCWGPFRGPGMWLGVGGWTLTYCINWLVQYFVYRRRVSELNRKIRARQGGGDEHEGH